MKLPLTMYSPLGPIPVVPVGEIPSEPEVMVMGRYNYGNRTIEISSSVRNREGRLMVAFHEWVHVVLMDSGVSQFLSPQAEEAVCDAIGTALAGAVQNKYLTLRNVRQG
jgi:hypothetical protein